jgi:hypothetical protein
VVRRYPVPVIIPVSGVVRRLSYEAGSFVKSISVTFVRCRRWDSNPHARREPDLSPLRSQTQADTEGLQISTLASRRWQYANSSPGRHFDSVLPSTRMLQRC